MSPDQDLAILIETVTGARPGRMTTLSGGCISACHRVELADGEAVVVKRAGGDEDLETEAWMLRYLAEHSGLPVPAVLHAEPGLLIMEHVETGGRLDADAERDAARHLAALHSVSADGFGLERDTLIGGLHQPNAPVADGGGDGGGGAGDWGGGAGDWVAFFRDRRLLYMADTASEVGRLPARTRHRIDALAARLGDLLPRRPPVSLIHGDMWGGNVLVRDGAVAAFIDPAVYYADAEIELAFSTLFGTFGNAFFETYCAIRPLAPKFREERRDLLNLYPLLVHVRLFGSGYVGQVEEVLRRFGV